MPETQNNPFNERFSMTAFLTLNIACDTTGDRADLLNLLAEHGYQFDGENPKIVGMSIDPPAPQEKADLPRDHLEAHYLVLLKSARRCAYDLRHAADEIPDDVVGYRDRALMWLDIFAPDGVKDYRLQLHRDIVMLETEVKSLKKKLRENGIDVPDWFID